MLEKRMDDFLSPLVLQDDLFSKKMLSKQTEERLQVVRILQAHSTQELTLRVLPVDIMLDRILPHLVSALLREERLPVPVEIAQCYLQHQLSPSTTRDGRGCRFVEVDNILCLRLVSPDLGDFDMLSGPNHTDLSYMWADNHFLPFVASSSMLRAMTYGAEYIRSNVGMMYRMRFPTLLRRMDAIAMRSGLELIQYADQVPRTSTYRAADAVKDVQVFALENTLSIGRPKVFMWIDSHPDTLDAVLLHEDQWAEDPETSDAVVVADWNQRRVSVFHAEVTWSYFTSSGRDDVRHHARVDSEVDDLCHLCLRHTENVCERLNAHHGWLKHDLSQSQ